MKTRKPVLIVLICFLVFIASQAVFSQDLIPEQPTQTEEEKAETVQIGGAVPLEINKQESEIQWVWGEVVTVDLQNKAVFVKYLDYESDQEKEISLTADDATTFENVTSIDELKQKDIVSIDYVSMEGKNLAKNISVEKPEAVGVSDAENKPQDLTPQAQTVMSEPESTIPTGN